jgi:uncharacterized protein YggE
MDEQILKLLNKTFLLAAILVVGLLVFMTGQLFYQIKVADQQNQNQITVSGQGKVYAKPDIAEVSLGVTAQGKTVAEATQSGNTKMTSIIDAVKSLGVDAKDIQTTNYNLSPVYDYDVQPLMYSYYPVKGSQTIVGYKLDQQAQVKIRDFEKIADVLQQATNKGANLVGNLQFTVDNPEQYKEQARAEAIKQAKANAQNLAKTSGITLGKLINVYENYYPNYDLKAMGLGGGMAESAPAPSIEPGQQEINITINLTYLVK